MSDSSSGGVLEKLSVGLRAVPWTRIRASMPLGSMMRRAVTSSAGSMAGAALELDAPVAQDLEAPAVVLVSCRGPSSPCRRAWSAAGVPSGRGNCRRRRARCCRGRRPPNRGGCSGPRSRRFSGICTRTSSAVAAPQRACRHPRLADAAAAARPARPARLSGRRGLLAVGARRPLALRSGRGQRRRLHGYGLGRRRRRGRPLAGADDRHAVVGRERRAIAIERGQHPIDLDPAALDHRRAGNRRARHLAGDVELEIDLEPRQVVADEAEALGLGRASGRRRRPAVGDRGRRSPRVRRPPRRAVSRSSTCMRPGSKRTVVERSR